jgi:membrane fusion protein (multidrug efflux system)
VGQWIAKGGNVVEIVELQTVEIIVQVLETQIGELAVRAGDVPGTSTLDVQVEAFPHEEFQGEVVAIVPQADYQSRTFPVKVRVENRLSSVTNTMMLKPGMFARATLPVRTVRDALLVPKDALVLDRRSPTVWRVQAPQDARTAVGSSVEPVSVQVDADVSVGEWIQVIGPLSTDGTLPLQPGDTVITEGNERVNVRTPVTIADKPSS